jgi:hypothetical protein
MFVDWGRGPWPDGRRRPKATYPDWYEQKLFTDYRDYHVKTWGADIGPDDLIELLGSQSFSPRKLAALAKSSGMRYVVPFLASRRLRALEVVVHASQRGRVGHSPRRRAGDERRAQAAGLGMAPTSRWASGTIRS